jgi:hypothetical protein
MTVARRLGAVALVAAGVALLAGPGLGLIAAGAGLAWSGVDIPVAATVRRLVNLHRPSQGPEVKGADDSPGGRRHRVRAGRGPAVSWTRPTSAPPGTHHPPSPTPPLGTP